jgi:putative oxidoreductase
MSDTTAIDVALLVLRCMVGAVMLAHGVNHVIGGGKIAGTARWFGSMGMRAPKVQAWVASATEVCGGISLILGLLTPLGGASVIGVMVVALTINHRKNGFFIFRPGEGWEYVATLMAAGLALAVTGAGSWSLDHAGNIDDDLVGATGLAIAVIGGLGGGLTTLLAFWRPVKH